MKTRYLLFIILLSAVFSCKNNQMEGLCDKPIFAEPFSGIILDARAQSTVVETDNDFWSDYGYVYHPAGGVLPDWIVVEKTEAKTLNITVEENTSGRDRAVEIQLRAGNCFAHFTVTQEPAAEPQE